MIEYLFALAVVQSNLDVTNVPSVTIAAEQQALTPYPYPQMRVAVGSPIPDGWVITSNNAGKYTITDVRTAVYDPSRVFTVVKESPIPDGFIVHQEYSTSREISCVRGLNYGSGSKRASEFSPVPKGWVATRKGELTPTIGAPYLTTLGVLQGSVLPDGWAIAKRSLPGGYDEILNLNGAIYRDTRYTALASPLPQNWVITRIWGTANEITYIGGARYYDRITVAVGSPIPAGWVSIINTISDTELVYTVGAQKGETIRVKVSSPIPSGWVITSSEPGSYVITYLG